MREPHALRRDCHEARILSRCEVADREPASSQGGIEHGQGAPRSDGSHAERARRLRREIAQPSRERTLDRCRDRKRCSRRRTTEIVPTAQLDDRKGVANCLLDEDVDLRRGETTATGCARERCNGSRVESTDEELGYSSSLSKPPGP